jgi:tetratricopeptide (TPR) repeat protein
MRAKEAGMSSTALERHLEFLAADPQNLRLLAQCADLALEEGRAADAVGLIERALALKPGDPYFNARLANVRLALGEVEGAIEILEGLVQSGETAAALRYNLGYALMHAGRYAQAKEQLAAAAGEVPQAAQLLVRAHHHLGELEEAILVAEEFATAHPENAEVSGQLAMLYFDADDLTKARAWSDKAIALPRKTPEAYSTAGFLALGDEDEQRAQELLGRALELNPKSGRAWAGKGMAEMFGGDFDAAEAALVRAVEHMPQHIGTWHALGWCRIMRRDLDGAEACFRKAYELDRSFDETHGALAVIEILRGAGNRAQRRADTALRLNPESLSGQLAKVLLEPGSEAARAASLRKILASQQSLKGGSLLDLAARHAARRRP